MRPNLNEQCNSYSNPLFSTEDFVQRIKKLYNTCQEKSFILLSQLRHEKNNDIFYVIFFIELILVQT